MPGLIGKGKRHQNNVAKAIGCRNLHLLDYPIPD